MSEHNSETTDLLAITKVPTFQTVSVTQDLVVERCIECGVLFAWPLALPSVVRWPCCACWTSHGLPWDYPSWVCCPVT